MKATLTWLKQFVDIDISPEDLAEFLTMRGLEVENLTKRYSELDTVVVGKIIEIIPHPHTKNLLLCQVYTGKGTYPIVCGAKNVKVNDIVPVAMPGTTLPSGTRIEKITIRNVDSLGMLCSEADLGLGNDTQGIMVLPPNLRAGEKIISALQIDDYLFEFSITPNRPDCLSIIGIAREVAAILNKTVKYPWISVEERGEGIKKITGITVENHKLCLRYSARLISNVTVKPSPFWMRDRLSSIGIRPINNIVDITNYVLMECGQPLHAFDFEKLAQGRIVVRQAKNGEMLTTLDGQQHTLTQDMLVICDALKPIALAGIMGGLATEITDATSTVLIESAFFDPVCTRRASRMLGIVTESSTRFEKGVDPEGVILALDRAAHLMAEITGGEIAKNMIDIYPRPFLKREITLRTDLVNKSLGIELTANNIKSYLAKIEITCKKMNKGQLILIPPSYRHDLGQEVDLIEEVIRLHGYDKIPVSVPTAALIPPKKDEFRRLRGCVKEILTSSGYTEIITYGFISKGSFDKLEFPPHDFRRRFVAIRNPLTEEQSVMRTTLLPGLLEAMQYNAYHNNPNLRIFELGKIFIDRGSDSLPQEIHMLSGLVTGLRRDFSWYASSERVDVFDIKGSLEILLEQMGVKDASFVRRSCPPYLKMNAFSELVINGEGIGFMGEVKKEVLERYDLQETAYIFDLNLDLMLKYFSKERMYKPLPKYPAIMRDVALMVDEAFEFGEVLEIVKDPDHKFVEDIQIFDIYKGKQINPGKKGLTFRITYRSSERTLEDREVNEIHQRIISKLIKKPGVGLRK